MGEKSFWTREVSNIYGLMFFAAMFGFLGASDPADFAPFLRLGIFGLLFWLGLVGICGLSIKYFMLFGFGAAPIIFGLSLLYSIANTEIPEEIRSDQILANIVAEELHLYNLVARLDVENAAVYAEISIEQSDVNTVRLRANNLWSAIPVGAVLTRNHVPVGDYKTVVSLRDDVRVRQSSLNNRKRALALERSINIDHPDISRLQAEQRKLTEETVALAAQIGTFKQSPRGRLRTFARIVMGLVALLFIALIFFIFRAISQD